MLKEKMLNTIQLHNLIQPHDKIVIGVSGGPDSMCLLANLYELKEKLQIELIVAHVNHMIRKEADEETVYVENYCKQKEIPCFIKKIDVTEEAKKQKIGTEEMGREIRYEFFEEVFKKVNANKIATAHHADDHAETVLFNLLRGSGITGLQGISVIREEKYIRPLRECTKQEIQKDCIEKELNPKYDLSNLDNTYTRNKIRNELIPYLQKEFNPNLTEAFDRLSKIVKLEEEYIQVITKQEYEKIRIEGNQNEVVLDVKQFNKVHPFMKTQIILYTIKQIKGNVQGIEKVHVDDIIKLCERNIGNKYLSPQKGLEIYLKKGKTFFRTKANLP